MSIMKCKMCGGDVRLDEDKTFGTCEYCGCTMTFPKVSDEQRAAAFNRGNHFRRIGEFDKALAVYERILAEDDADAEAHWCCALCRFGIEYVEDPNTYEWLPTCHRASFDSFLEDVDYLAALEHSEGITRRQYQKDAAKIAEVQRGILATSRSTEPYDVFISYKELDETGERTRDSILAQEIYYRLTEKGWRVFFSRISLEDVPGTEYEPYIFAALNSAKVMVVVGTSEANLNAVWVKNEWSRFLAMMRKDRSKLLIPCYRDMDPYDLPEQLSVLMSYDMGRIGFMQDLIRGVDKVLSAEKPKEPAPAPVQERVIVQQSGGPNVTAMVKRGQQALEDGDWEKADEFFDQALNMDAESAEAFLGKFLAQEETVTLDELFKQHLAECDRRVKSERKTIPDKTEAVRHLIDTYALPGYLAASDLQKELDFDLSYQSFLACRQAAQEDEREWLNGDRLLGRARRYATGETGEKIEAAIGNFEQQLSARVERSQKQEEQNREKKQAEYDAFLAQAEKRFAEQNRVALEAREAEYQACCARQEKAETVEDYQNAIAAFQEKLSDYKDTEGRISQCRAEIERLNEQERQRKAAEAQAAAAEKAEREKAAALAKEKKKKRIIVAAILAAVLVTGAWLGYAKVIIPMQQYKAAEKLLAAEEYKKASSAFMALGTYKDSAERFIEIQEIQYTYAETLYSEENYLDAHEKFEEVLQIFRDSPIQEAAFAFYSERADQNDAVAAFYLGKMFDNGYCVETNYKKALEYYLKAANAGSMWAMSNIGNMYYDGNGVDQDYEKAMEWYLKAANAGNEAAMNNIGVMYDTGNGVKQDYEKAMEWYLKAADAGEGAAMCNIGWMYDTGNGVKQDYEKALEWYLKAADAGDEVAMNNIGKCYKFGHGVKIDNRKAAEWFQRAREAGYTG